MRGDTDMGWWEAVKTWVREALLSPAGYDMDGEPASSTKRQRTRDLSKRDQAEMLRVCNYLYDAHPLAGWIIDQRVALLVGDELGFSVEITGGDYAPEEAEAVAKRIKTRLEHGFWNHPAFSLRMRADDLVTSLLVDGELCLPLAPGNSIDGLPMLDMVNAKAIAEVKPLDGSGLIPATVMLTPNEPGAPAIPVPIVQFDSRAQRYGSGGGCFFFKRNRLANAMRGRSDLLRIADWLDILDQWLFARADRATLLNALVWDLTIKNGGPDDVKKRSDEWRANPPTNPGNAYIHSDREELKPLTPDMHADDATTEMKLIRNFILGCLSIPESWFSDGGDTTRTTAGEQNDVALMVLRRDRKTVKAMFGTMLHYAYDQLAARQPALYPPRIAHGIVIEPDLPPLDEKDISRIGGVIQNLEAALESAVRNKRISHQTSRSVMLHMVDRLGVPVDADDDQARITSETASGQYDDLHKAQQLMQRAIARQGEKPPGPTGAASARQADTHPAEV